MVGFGHEIQQIRCEIQVNTVKVLYKIKNSSIIDFQNLNKKGKENRCQKNKKLSTLR